MQNAFFRDHHFLPYILMTCACPFQTLDFMSISRFVYSWRTKHGCTKVLVHLSILNLLCRMFTIYEYS